MMTVSLTNALVYPKQQLGGLAISAAIPVFACRLSHFRESIMCLKNSRYRFPVRFANGCLKRRAYPVANYDGLWEDPDDDVSDDDSEYDDEEEKEEENDLNYESDWEANGNDKAVVVSSKVEELSTRMYEDDLVKEVEQMLTAEERAILEQNEAPDLDKLSTSKWKLMHTFALAGQIKSMDGLLEKGYNIELVDKDGLTALHLAVIGKREAVISHLLRKGANPEAKDQDGATPLHYAAQVGALQTVKLLIKNKVDVNVADNEGWTPLHVAMQTRNRDIAKVLLVNGADKTRRNQDGNTALDLSLCYGKDFKSYELAKLVKQVSATRGF
ncbi:ankyrin repeat domain-containing protein emb506 chloroplastic [Phtheirospermum japonicum]|uniref:Ankyrin repeat domain-containing protein emb506 chloroplastic n=1 Tax=Phtheirospermum japonicum TaxID=374723 RepID=A0A830CL39_9LAMI|nr:ankyrin repeat domain-containing protein emb506 chloroplastic [Phtheirospermum japonicum]